MAGVFELIMGSQKRLVGHHGVVQRTDPRALELQAAMEILAEVFGIRTSEAKEIYEDWLFPSRVGDQLTSRQIQKVLDAIAERAGLQEVKFKDRAGHERRRIHPHLLRHGFAMWSLDNGVPIYGLQRQLGHASLEATGIYLEASPNHRKESYMRSKVSNCLRGSL